MIIKVTWNDFSGNFFSGNLYSYLKSHFRLDLIGSFCFNDWQPSSNPFSVFYYITRISHINHNQISCREHRASLRVLYNKDSVVSEIQRRKNLIFVNLLPIMTPSEIFCQVVMCRMLTRLFILLLLTEISRDRNNYQQERSETKRGPEENYDDCSSGGNFEAKSIQLCWLLREIALNKNFRETKHYPQNLGKSVCKQSPWFLSITLAKNCFFFIVRVSCDHLHI